MFEDFSDLGITNDQPEQMVQHVALILDQSGSMTGMESTVRETIREQIEAVKKLSKENNIKTYITICLFSHSRDIFIKTFNSDYADEAIKYGCNNYHPSGTTALFDSMFKVITIIEELNRGSKSSSQENLVITVSDGQENCSVEINKDILKKKIDALEKDENIKWKFVYLGTMESLESAYSVGIGISNSLHFSDADSLKRGSGSTICSTQSYYDMRSKGMDTKALNYGDETDPDIYDSNKADPDIYDSNKADENK